MHRKWLRVHSLLTQLAADLMWDKTGIGTCWAAGTASATVKILGGGHSLPACVKF